MSFSGLITTLDASAFSILHDIFGALLVTDVVDTKEEDVVEEREVFGRLSPIPLLTADTEPFAAALIGPVPVWTFFDWHDCIGHGQLEL